MRSPAGSLLGPHVHSSAVSIVSYTASDTGFFLPWPPPLAIPLATPFSWPVEGHIWNFHFLGWPPPWPPSALKATIALGPLLLATPGHPAQILYFHGQPKLYFHYFTAFDHLFDFPGSLAVPRAVEWSGGYRL